MTIKWKLGQKELFGFYLFIYEADNRGCHVWAIARGLQIPEFANSLSVNIPVSLSNLVRRCANLTLNAFSVNGLV